MGIAQVIIVNEKDEIIGYKPRDLLDKQDIYRVAALWIKNSRGDILLAQRAFSKKNNPGKWGPAAAGTVEEGETYDINIVKEAEEEIGLTGYQFEKGPKTLVSGEYRYVRQFYTLIIDKKIEEFTIDKKEVAGIRWFSREELLRELREMPGKFLDSVEECVL